MQHFQKNRGTTHKRSQQLRYIPLSLDFPILQIIFLGTFKRKIEIFSSPSSKKLSKANHSEALPKVSTQVGKNLTLDLRKCVTKVNDTCREKTKFYEL